MGLGQMHQPVGVESRAAASDVEAEGQTLALRHARKPLLGFTCLLDGHSVLLRQTLCTIAGALIRRVGVELEATPGHIDLIAVLEPLESGFETTLTDVAPRACDVRPDLDVHGRLLC